MRKTGEVRGPEDLLPDWFALLDGYHSKEFNYWRDWLSQAAAEDAAAIAFSKLPAARQSELLAQPVTA